MNKNPFKTKLTPAARQRMLIHQKGLCSICKQPPDHESLTGRYFPEHDEYLELCHWRCHPSKIAREAREARRRLLSRKGLTNGSE